MFQDPAEYNATNYIPQRETQKALEKYHSLMKYKGNDLILDVGCGSGNVITQVYLPFTPHSNFQLVAIDKFKHMVDFASKNVRDPRITFRVLDIQEKNEELVKSVFTNKELNTGFNLVFSFNCLQFNAQNLSQCYENIYLLMKPGGQMFILTMGYSIVGEIWKSVHTLKKWRPYLEDVPVYTYPFHDSKDPVKECTDMLKKIGFEDIICSFERKPMLPDDSISPPMRSVMEYIDPYLHAIPQNLHLEYMADVMKLYDLWLEENPGFPYDNVIIIASKPSK